MSKKVNIEEEIKKRAILDYTDSYRKQYIQEIKNSFVSKCAQDSTIDEKFKEFVRNTDNINVAFHYGWDMKVYFYGITVKINCSYTYSGSYTTGYSGTATVSSSGKVEVSNVHANTESYTAKHEKMYTEHVSPTVRETFVSDVGDAKYDAADANHYVEKQAGDPMPEELKKISQKTFSFAEIDANLRAPDIAINKAKSMVESYHRTDFKVSTSYAGMEDYGIDEIELYFLPKSFDLWVEYEGKKYVQTGVKSPNNIHSDGKKSEHYNHWRGEVGAMWNAKACSWIPKTIVSIGGFLPLLFAILYFVEKRSNVFMTIICTIAPLGALIILGPAALGIFIAVKCFNRFDFSNSVYVSDIPICDIGKKVKQEYLKLVLKRIVWALLYVLVCYGIGALIRR